MFVKENPDRKKNVAEITKGIEIFTLSFQNYILLNKDLNWSHCLNEAALQVKISIFSKPCWKTFQKINWEDRRWICALKVNNKDRINTPFFTCSLNLFQSHYHRVYHQAYLNVLRISFGISDNEMRFIRHTNKVTIKVTYSGNKNWKFGHSTLKASLIKGALNPFFRNVPFWSPWNHQKTKGFLMFSGQSKGKLGRKGLMLT